LILYLIIKKDWRTVISSILTTLILNLIALLWMGIGPFMEYYLRVSTQVLEIYHKFWANFSAYTLGYRLFEGTDSAIFANNYHALPLINLPGIAPLISIGFVVLFLTVSMVWAVKSNDLETSFAILVNLMVAISPIVWDHYYVMVTISLVVLLRNLARRSFPTRLTMVSGLIFLLLFLFNDRIGDVMIYLNGGVKVFQAHGYQLSFASSLITLLPLLELAVLTILLWSSRLNLPQEQMPDTVLLSMNPQSGT
jgi:hypothetical protein